MTCTFFGHNDTPQDIRGKLKDTLIYMIEKRGADLFYVGDHGNFDRAAISVLRELCVIYPHIRYYVVPAYLPESDPGYSTLFPEGIENVPKRFAISYRNKWLVNNSDAVIAYIRRSYGGAAQFAKSAEKKKKEIIDLAK